MNKPTIQEIEEVIEAITWELDDVVAKVSRPKNPEYLNMVFRDHEIDELVPCGYGRQMWFTANILYLDDGVDQVRSHISNFHSSTIRNAIDSGWMMVTSTFMSKNGELFKPGEAS